MLESLSAREKQIIHFLTESPQVSVAELGKRLGVSEVTIRTDLKNLAARGLITRTHGGALPAFHKNILDRQSLRSDEKHRLARAAAELVQNGDTIMIQAGTTTALLSPVPLTISTQELGHWALAAKCGMYFFSM